MKPNFALNFTDTGIELLHRTAGGWSLVGDTPFDAADLTDALDYLRKTALGLEPAGIVTKLVIPNSQILYAEVDAPGPSEEERRSQIASALEGRTPYKADEIVFDFSGRGKQVRVAAVARETLAEAEAFAAEHKFNPVSFVAIPDGSYHGEPWFGPTGAAAGVTGGGLVERDRHAIVHPGARGKVAAVPDAPEAGDEAAIETEVAPVAVAAGPAEAPPPAEMAEAAPLRDSLAEAAPAFADAVPVPVPVTPPADIVAAAAIPEPAEARHFAAAVADEAPFAEIADPDPLPESVPEPLSGPLDDIPPMPAGLAHAGVSAPGLAAGIEDDLPPPPSAAARAAFATRRGADSPGPARMPPPLGSNARPDAATLARAARGKPAEDVPPAARPATPPRPAPGAAKAPRGIGGLVTAPGIPGTRKPAKTKGPAIPPPRPVPPAAATVPATSASDAAKSLARSPFGSKPTQRGRPRFLLLILVAILLVFLAFVALWSSISLSWWQGGADVETTVDAGAPDSDMPAVEDEMLADAQDPEELADAAAIDPADPAAADPAVVTGDDAAVAEVAPVADPVVAEDPADVAEAAEAEAPPAEETAAAPVAEAAPETGLGAETPDAVALTDPQDEIFLATAEAPPPAFDALALPPPARGGDAAPEPPMPPPPPGTVYRFDGNGLIVPTPEGIPSPAGFMLFAGKPDRVPPPRSAVAEAAAAAALAATTPAADAAAAADVAAPDGVDAALAEAGAAAAPVVVAPVAAGPEAQPDPELADRRPRARPETLVPATAEDDAALGGGEETSFASLRPRERPPTVLAAGDRARAETAGASLAGAEAGAGAGTEVVPVALSASDAANPSLLAISRRPAAKPEDFSRAVEAAVAAAVRAPEAAPQPEETVAAAAPAPKPEEHEEIDEPEVVAAAPKIPTKASVAKQATFKNAINLSKVNLIGVYGTQSKRYALVRMSNGKYKKVKVGDRFEGGRIEAITQSEVRYQKGSRLVTLAMPKG